MENLENFYQEYTGTNSVTITTSGESGTFTYSSGYTCPYCHFWVNCGDYHSCYPYYTHVHSPQRNRTEEAFKIIKVLVKEQVIEEPTTFTEFCNLIEKMAKVI